MTDDPAALNSAGLRALGQGDATAAATLLARAAAADPASALLWYNLATAHAATGDEAAERTALDAALDREPFFDHALLAKGRLLEHQGDARGALDHYQRLLAALQPGEAHGPGFAAGIGHARAFVATTTAALAAHLDTALAPLRALVAPAEARRFEHCVDLALGRRRLYAPQPLVLNYPYLPPEQFVPRAHFPWLTELEAATPAIRTELEALLAAGGDGFAPYVAYPPGSPVNQWAGLNHSADWSARFLFRDGVAQDETRARCPRTAALLDRLPLFDLPGRGPVAFFSLLRPRTRIPPHTGATNIRTIIHLPLIVPAGCGFRVGNETRPWVEGEAFAFDDTIEHEAWNDSDEPRGVLIVDTWNPHLTAAERTLLRGYVAALDGAGAGLGGFEPG